MRWMGHDPPRSSRKTGFQSRLKLIGQEPPRQQTRRSIGLIRHFLRLRFRLFFMTGEESPAPFVLLFRRRLVCPPRRAGRERLTRASLRETNMRSKQGRGALLGLVVTSLLLGVLVSPSMAQVRGLLGAGMATRRVTAAAIRAADGATTRALTTHRGRDITLAAATMAAGASADRGATRIPTGISPVTGPSSAPATTGRATATPATADSAAELSGWKRQSEVPIPTIPTDHDHFSFAKSSSIA